VPSRGDVELVTNRFHFNGGTPANGAAWDTLFGNIIDALRACLIGEAVFKQADGYAAGSNVAVRTTTYNRAGNIAAVGADSNMLPGFCCALLRWSTTARTSKNHPIYLYSYVHGVCDNGGSATTSQQLDSLQLAALQDFAQTFWETGFSDGTNSYTRAGPNGTSATDSEVDQYVRSHDLHPR
jgi:hypothetical protein